jgi:diacylglycerol kinase family enzyme
MPSPDATGAVGPTLDATRAQPATLPAPAQAPAPPLPPGRPLHVVSVRAAGAADATLWQALQQHAAAAGRRLVLHAPAHPAGLAVAAQQAAQAARADAGVVVAIGGDGTLNTVGQACWRSGVPMGVVAQGTFNFFARQQALPQGLDEALTALLQALAAGWLRPVQVGQVNGQVFLVNASLGLYPRLLADREQASRRFGRHRLVALLAGVASLLRPHFGHRLRLLLRTAQGQEHSTQRLASTLFVGNNALQLRNVGLPEAQAVQHGALGVVALAPQRPLGMLRLLWRAWRGRLADDAAVDNFACTALTVLADPRRLSARIKVAFDGESRWMTLPVQFAVSARPLWLVAGPQPDAAPLRQAVPAAGPGLPLAGGLALAPELPR